MLAYMPERTESRFRSALDLLREMGDRRSEAHSLHRLAILLRNAGNAEEGVSLARASHRLYTEIGSRGYGLERPDPSRVPLSYTRTAPKRMLFELLLMAETLATDLGDLPRLANVCQEESLIFRRLGRYQEAREKGELGLALARQIGQFARLAWCQIIWRK